MVPLSATERTCLNALAQALGSSEDVRRDAPRVDTRLEVQLANCCAFEAALVRDISRGGFRVSTTLRARVGERLTLHARSEAQEEFLFPVRVVWHDGDALGLELIGMPTCTLRRAA